MSIDVIEIRLPVAGMPGRSPRWVPVIDDRHAARSPSWRTSEYTARMSGKACRHWAANRVKAASPPALRTVGGRCTRVEHPSRPSRLRWLTASS
jgi:hypothetical protein